MRAVTEMFTLFSFGKKSDEKSELVKKLLLILADCERTAAEQLKPCLGLSIWSSEDRAALEKIRFEELGHGEACFAKLEDIFGASTRREIEKVRKLRMPNHFIRAFNQPLEDEYDVVVYTAVMDLCAMFIISNMGQGGYEPFQHLAKYLLDVEASHFGFGWSKMKAFHERDPQRLLTCLEKWIRLAFDNFGTEGSKFDLAKVRLGLVKSSCAESKRSFALSLNSRIMKAELKLPPSFWNRFTDLDPRFMERVPELDIDIEKTVNAIGASAAVAVV